jgi:hypothetical protein
MFGFEVTGTVVTGREVTGRWWEKSYSGWQTFSGELRITSEDRQKGVMALAHGA